MCTLASPFGRGRVTGRGSGQPESWSATTAWPGRVVVVDRAGSDAANPGPLEASRLLADRGWGNAAVFAPPEGDPFDLEDVEAAAEEFRRMVLRLAADEPEAS